MMRKAARAGSILLLTMIIAGALFALPAFAEVSGLERIHADFNGTWYINTKTMVNPSGDRISFWSTVVPEKGGMYFSRLAAVLEKARKDPFRMAYVQTLQEVDCSTLTINASNILFYDKRDRIVHTINAPGSAQLIAEFGQAVNSLLAAVCGPQLAQLTEEERLEK